MEKFKVFYENEEGELKDIEELYYLVKNNLLLELELDEYYTYYIRQWKDIPIDYND